MNVESVHMPKSANEVKQVWHNFSIIKFLHTFRRAWDNNGIHRGDAMGLIPYFMKKSAAAVLIARLLQISKRPCKEVYEIPLTYFIQLYNYVL